VVSASVAVGSGAGARFAVDAMLRRPVGRVQLASLEALDHIQPEPHVLPRQRQLRQLATTGLGVDPALLDLPAFRQLLGREDRGAMRRPSSLEPPATR
jgi:hypothetical protein